MSQITNEQPELSEPSIPCDEPCDEKHQLATESDSIQLIESTVNEMMDLGMFDAQGFDILFDSILSRICINCMNGNVDNCCMDELCPFHASV